MKKNSYNKIKILFYYTRFFSSYNPKYRIINVNNKYINNQDFQELFFIQIELEHLISELSIKIINDNNQELKGRLKVKDINNYFSFENFHFDKSSPDNEIFNLINDTIFTEFYNFFFDKNLNYGEKFKIDMMNSLINHKSEVLLSGNNILKFLKFCLKYNLEIKKISKNIKFDKAANDYIEK